MPQATSERHTSPPSPSCRQRAEIFCYMEYISGTVGSSRLTLKAKKNLKFNIEAVDGFIVDKHLNTVKF